MAQFETPKTNWVSEDYININDYNRILNNLLYISAEMLSKYYIIPESFYDIINEEVTYNDYPTADKWNMIENKLEELNNITGGILNIGDKKTFYPGGSYIDYNELNRIEKATLMFYNLYYRLERAKIVLPFTLGNYGGF